MKILVCGGRDYGWENKESHIGRSSHDWDTLFDELDRLLVEAGEGNLAICHGGANGADKMAGVWAGARGVECTVYPANWDVYGKQAGPVRNELMLNDFQPDLVIAFPGGKGTKDMTERAGRAGYKVIIISP